MNIQTFLDLYYSENQQNNIRTAPFFNLGFKWSNLLASRRGCFAPRVKCPAAPCGGSWMVPMAGLDAFEGFYCNRAHIATIVSSLSITEVTELSNFPL